MIRLLADGPYGTAAFYDTHVYSLPLEPDWMTLPLYPDSVPSKTLEWFAGLRLGTPQHILEIGCGGGRNIREAHRLFPDAQRYGFDGSPNAVAVAREAMPGLPIRLGDMHGEWPLKALGRRSYDLILDITTGIPESIKRTELQYYLRMLYRTLQPGGYAIVEAIAPDDGLASSCEQHPTSTAADSIIVWCFRNGSKLERVIDLEAARTLYADAGFTIVASRKIEFEEPAFGRPDVTRRYIQLILRKP